MAAYEVIVRLVPREEVNLDYENSFLRQKKKKNSLHICILLFFFLQKNENMQIINDC